MARPSQQVLADEQPDVVKDFRVANRMQAMAPIISLESTEFETACIAPDGAALLQHERVCQAAAGQLPGGAKTGQSST